MEDNISAVLAGTGADVDEVVGGLHDGLLVLDYDEEAGEYVAAFTEGSDADHRILHLP